MSIFSVLLVGHVVLTTGGYVGLIATNLVVLGLCRSRDPALVSGAVGIWRRSTRVFGPVLGIGILAGFALAGAIRTGFVFPWLLATYALIVAAMATQAAVMIPWQRRAQEAAAAGASVSSQPVVVVVWVFTFVYIAIVALMLLRPG